MVKKHLVLMLLTVFTALFTLNCNAVDRKNSEKEEAPMTSVKTQQPAVQDESSLRETPVVKAIRKVEDSVVNIRTEKTVEKSVNPFFNDSIFSDPFFDDFFGMRKRQYKTQSLGSGVIIADDGTVLTNYHVVKDATDIFVITRDNANYEAEFVGGDESIDLAVLKIKDKTKRFPHAELGSSSDLMLGEPIIAIGNPYGLNSSVTTGVISAKARVVKIGNYYSVFIQTDALINPGNSGGPLLNIYGEVIGVNSAIYKEAQGIGFSIPIDTAKRALPELLKNGKMRRGHTGFTALDVTKGDDVVLTIDSVEKGSNAEKIGLKTGDEIVEIADVPVASEQAMYHILRSYPPETSVEIGVSRDGETFKGRLLLTERPSDYGLTILEEKYGIVIEEKNNYLTVTRSTLTKYIKSGDIIVAFNEKELNSMEQLSSLLEENQEKSFLFTLYRNNRLLQVKLNP
jgi:S1-C subfamily serine protease